MSNKFRFDRDFQIGIITLFLQSQDFLVTITPILQGSYFEDVCLIWFYNVIKDYYEKYKSSPTSLVLGDYLNKAIFTQKIKGIDVELYKETLEKIKQPVNEEQYVIDEVIKFCRQQEIKRVYLETADKIYSDDPEVFDIIQKKVIDACNIGTTITDLGINYFDSYKERIRAKNAQETELRFTTGVLDLDEQIGGGVRAGQLFIYVGASGGGKSIGLAHAAKANVIEGKRGIIYTLELDEKDIAERLDAAWSAIPINELFSRNEELISNLDDLKVLYDNQLYIKFYPTKSASIGTIKAHLKQLRLKGFVPDFVVVDYIDLLKTSSGYADLYADLGDITAHLRGLAGELKVPIFTATQANRVGNVSETIDVDNVADSMQKVFIADIMIAICRTNDEINNDRARLFTMKNRNGRQKVTIPIQNDYARMMFYKKDSNEEMKTALKSNLIIPPGRKK